MTDDEKWERRAKAGLVVMVAGWLVFWALVVFVVVHFVVRYW